MRFVIMAPAFVTHAAAPALASSFIMSVRDITPIAMPSLSHTTTSGVLGFAKIWAASGTSAFSLTTANRSRAAARMCFTRVTKALLILSPCRHGTPHLLRLRDQAQLPRVHRLLHRTGQEPRL